MREAVHAYNRTFRSALSPREAEAAVLLKAAMQLQSVRDDWDNQAPALREALDFNRKLWTILSVSVAAPDSPLPQHVRQGMTDLSVFVFRRILDTMIEPAAEKLGALISINRNLAAGLRGE